MKNIYMMRKTISPIARTWEEYEVPINGTDTWFVIGRRGSGKSSFLEALAENHFEAGNVIFDMFGSKDGEGLAWLRRKGIDEKKVLLLRGEAVDVVSSHDTKVFDQLSFQDLDNYDLIISSSPLYINPDQEYYAVNKMIDMLYKRHYWKRLMFLVVREAANLFYSRLKAYENQTVAKADAIYFIREARHMGVSMGIDSVRYEAIDVDIRHLADYMIFKAQGSTKITRDLYFLFRYFSPSAIRQMRPYEFIWISTKGDVGAGVFDMPEWHKKPSENIMRAVGLKVEYGELPTEAKVIGKYKTISSQEHVDIIKAYLEGNSMRKVASMFARSSASVSNHIYQHDFAIKRSGFCPICRSVKADTERTPAMVDAAEGKKNQSNEQLLTTTIEGKEEI